jgi:phosphoglycolate phosphatase
VRDVTNVEAILFDLDGTLTDPYEGIARCITFAMERVGKPLAPSVDLARYIGPPLHASFRELCAPDDEIAVLAVAAFRERYGSVGIAEYALYPGIIAMLEDARAIAPLYVCTSKPTVYATRVLAHAGLDGFFAGVYGSELDGVRGDKAELMAYLLEREALAGRRTVMIGDREHDVRAARRHGVAAFGVLWGYGSKDELRAAGAHALVSAPSEVAAMIRNLRGNGVAVRPAREADFPELIGLFEEVAAERSGIGTEPGFDHEAYRRGWRRLIEGRGGALFVATVGGAVVGTLSVIRDAEIGCEVGLLVANAQRRRGIGMRLLETGIDWARANGVAEIALLVFPHNFAAITLYQRAGFTTKARWDRYKRRGNGEIWDVLLMTRAV